jgi:Mg2+ and Co2+ transporter CorA
MTNRPRTEHTLTPPTAEEYRVRNKEYRGEKRMALAQKIAHRTTNRQMNIIQGITNEIYNIAKQIKLIKASYSYPDAKKEKVSKQIIEMQNRVYELQTYLVRMAEAALGMYD